MKRWTDSRRRYHDSCVPQRELDRVRVERERLSRIICWAAVAFLLVALAPHLADIPELFR